ncbi:DUF1294 domain-containing protein [Pseudalkalibacillus caeni]|uniref:DUF1294 domain-containing protein n=2 Tax=Exobacillus caeni TaxID=2574798 RepID=A0A5R9FB08_9BACL|nr:DUF1294 domain-containing protein [Pseudalkalibacillus caeni]
MIANIFGFLVMGEDKKRARKQHWRISEQNLWLVALAGGAVGIYSGMKVFRHKTKHKSFIYGIPAVILLQAAIVLYLLVNL